MPLKDMQLLNERQNTLFHGIAKDLQLIFMGSPITRVLQGQCSMAQMDAMHAVSLNDSSNKCTLRKYIYFFNYMKL